MAGSRGDAKGLSTETLNPLVFNLYVDSEDILNKALDERKSEFVWLVRKSSQKGMLAVDYLQLGTESSESIRLALMQSGWKLDPDVNDENSPSYIEMTEENIEEHIGELFSFLEKFKFGEILEFPFSAANRLSPAIEDACFLKWQPFLTEKIDSSRPSQICALSDSLIAVIWPQDSKSDKLTNRIYVYDIAKSKYLHNPIITSPQAMTLNQDGSHLLVVNSQGLSQFEIKPFLLEESKREDFAESKYLARWEGPLTPYDMVCNSEGCVFVSFTNGLVQQLKPTSSKLEDVTKMDSSPRLHINKNNQLVCVSMAIKQPVKPSGPHHYVSRTPFKDLYYSIYEAGKKTTTLSGKAIPSLTCYKFFSPNQFAAINLNTIKILHLDSKVETQLPINDHSSFQLTTNAAGHLVTMSSKGHIKVWNTSRASDQCINEFKVNVNEPLNSEFSFYVNPFTDTLFYENHLGTFQELILDFNLREEEVKKCFAPKNAVKGNDVYKNIPYMHPGVIGIMLGFLGHKPSKEACIMKPKQQQEPKASMPQQDVDSTKKSKCILM